MNGKLIALPEFQERVHAWSEDNFDLRAESNETLFHDVQDIEVFETIEGSPWGHKPLTATRMTLDDHSKGQLSERFVLPRKFMFNDKYFPPELRKDVFEYKFKSTPQENMLIRGRHTVDGDTCRAVLTKHYRPYDNAEFIDAIVEAVSVKGVDPQTVEVGSWSIGSEMRGIGVLPNITFDQWNNGGPPTADGGGSGGLRPGFKFGNAEIGTLTTRIDGGGWRSYCDNGVVFGFAAQSGFRIVHRGQKVMSLMVNEGIADALVMSERGAKAYMEKMALKVERTDIGDIIEGWSTKYGFTVPSKEAWSNLVTAHAMQDDITEFDVINDLTYVARDSVDPAEQEVLQIAAGDMVFAETIERGLRRV